MRKIDREIRDFDEIIDVLNRCDTIRLGIHDEGYPYVVPLSFGFEVVEDRVIAYVHGANDGKKHDLLKVNNKVCVEADICHRFVEVSDGITTEYESIIGYGTAQKISGDEAIKGLNLLLRHCGYKDYNYDTSMEKFMTIYKISIEKISGKRRRT